MQKNIFLIIYLVFSFASIFAQTNEKSNISQNYSESVAYKPREFKDKELDKTKKSKNKDQKTKSVVIPEELGSVTIPVTVFDGKGKTVLGLKKTDFHIFINDKEVSDFELEQPDQSLDLILLIDTSPSAAFNIEDLQNFSLAFTENLKPQDKVLIAYFNEKLKIRTPLTNDREVIKKAIDKLKTGDGTSLYDSIQELVTQQTLSLHKRSAIVLITDGVDTTSLKTNYVKSLETAERYDVPFYVIYLDTFKNSTKISAKGLNNLGRLGIDPRLLNSIPGSPIGATQAEYDLGKLYLNDLMRLSGGRAAKLEIESSSKKATLPTFYAELRQKYYLTFKSPEIAVNGERQEVKIRVDRPNLSFYSKGSYILK